MYSRFKAVSKVRVAPRVQIPVVRSVRHRTLATKSNADQKVDDIAEQYAIAKDEFEIATEETEKRSIYASEDRATAREELSKLEETLEDAVSSSTPDEASEIRGRVGQRIRELKNAVENLNEADKED